MELLQTRNCMRQIVRTVGSVSVEQLERFFRNAPDTEKVCSYIEELIALGLFDYNEKTRLITYHGFPIYTEQERMRKTLILKNTENAMKLRREAFWVIAYFGYEQVRRVIPLMYPLQFWVVSEDKEVYDLTVCKTAIDGVSAQNARKKFELDGMPDEVNHIAIVEDAVVGREVMKYGFDSYCILGRENKIPEYFTDA